MRIPTRIAIKKLKKGPKLWIMELKHTDAQIANLLSKNAKICRLNFTKKNKNPKK